MRLDHNLVWTTLQHIRLLPSSNYSVEQAEMEEKRAVFEKQSTWGLGDARKTIPKFPRFPIPMGQSTGNELRISANRDRYCRISCTQTRSPALSPKPAVIAPGCPRGERPGFSHMLA